MTWTSATLGEVAASVDYGLTASATQVSAGPKFLRITDIQNDHVDWDSVPFCQATEREETDNSLAPGDIVFARTGATTGKSFLLRSCPERAVFASYLIRVRPSNQIDATYLSKFFQTENYWAQIRQRARGAAQPGVNSTVLKELVIPFPSLDKQRRIAAILDQADDMRRKRREGLGLLHELSQSIFVSKFIAESSYPKLPLSQVCTLITDGTHHTPTYAEDGTIFLSAKNVTSGAIDWSDVKYIPHSLHVELQKRVSPKRNDILLAKKRDNRGGCIG